MTREEAVRDSVASFGDPGAVAAECVRANRRHAEPSLLLVVLGLGIASGAMVSASNLPLAIHDALMCLVPKSGPLESELARGLITAVLCAPSAFLAGALVGRRAWWLPAVPPGVWVLLLLLLRVAWMPGYAAYLGQPAFIGLAFGLLGLLGSRCSRARWVRTAAWVYTALLVAAALAPRLADPTATVVAIIIAQPLAGVLLAARVWDAGRACRRAAVLLLALSVVCLVGIWAVSSYFADVPLTLALAVQTAAWLGLLARTRGAVFTALGRPIGNCQWIS